MVLFDYCNVHFSSKKELVSLTMSVFPVFFLVGGRYREKNEKTDCFCENDTYFSRLFLAEVPFREIIEKSKEVIVNRGERCLNEIDGVNFKEGIG